MKVVILAGGRGSRLSEETSVRPKPMIEIGGKPILWHIMKTYSYYGITDFIICLGYKGYMIKEYFINYHFHHADLTVDLASNSIDIHNHQSENWKVTLVDTGRETLTGGRIKQIRKYVEGETFLLTYGDGLCDVNITELVKYHRKHGCSMTVTAVKPKGRFGAMELLRDGKIHSFKEKPDGDRWINGGYFVCEPALMDYIQENDIMLEREPLERMAKSGDLIAFKHSGFWYAMDTVRDKIVLEDLWQTESAPWKLW